MSGHSDGPITIHAVKNKNDLREFVELAFASIAAIHRGCRR